MATSAIGPGFLTQTTVYTKELMANFGFVILISILLDIGAQLNIWRILAVSEIRAQDMANKLLPGLGYALSLLIVFGGLAFNIGNIAGCGLGLHVLSGIPVEQAAIISGAIAIIIFWMKEMGILLDTITKLLGIIMILLTLFIAISSNPPLGEAVIKSFIPDTINFTAIITLVGGTVGGYISFAGAHRLLDAGIKGKEQLQKVTQSAVSGIAITGTMRVLLFLAALGVVMKYQTLDSSNPAASVFQLAAGNMGYRFFGVVMWCAAITSVVGASYTSFSFIKTFHPVIEKKQSVIISCFIVLSTAVFILIGKPVQLLVTAGTINGFILPIALAVILLGGTKNRFMGNFRNPIWLSITGWLVVIALSWMSIKAALSFF